MRAALYRTTGPPERCSRSSSSILPSPAPGQVRVRITGSGINPTDSKARAGRPAPDGFQIPHHDGAGGIDALGPGVLGLAMGQRVWIHLAAFGNRVRDRRDERGRAR